MENLSNTKIPVLNIMKPIKKISKPGPLSLKLISSSSEGTQKIGKRLGKKIPKGSILLLNGDLGSGKTTFIKGIARGLKIGQTEVSSPTFVLMNVYHGRLPLFHFDLYRLNDIEEISSIGYDEFLYDDGVSVIEWADRLGKYLPKEYLKVELKHKEINERVVQLSANGSRYQKMVRKLKI